MCTQLLVKKWWQFSMKYYHPVGLIDVVLSCLWRWSICPLIQFLWQLTPSCISSFLSAPFRPSSLWRLPSSSTLSGSVVLWPFWWSSWGLMRRLDSSSTYPRSFDCIYFWRATVNGRHRRIGLAPRSRSCIRRSFTYQSSPPWPLRRNHSCIHRFSRYRWKRGRRTRQQSST